MNTANLKMEGTLLALAALCGALNANGVLTGEDIAKALDCAERGELSPTAPCAISRGAVLHIGGRHPTRTAACPSRYSSPASPPGE